MKKTNSKDGSHSRPLLMAHLIAGYPDLATSLEIAKALVEGGAQMLELQMPSSDPAADGPAIQAACTQALDRGLRLDHGFELAKRIVEATKAPLYIMAYACQIYARGIKRFVDDSSKAGVAGIIAPDLPVGEDEGLYAACAQSGLDCVPVIPITAPQKRVEEIMAAARPARWVYTALRAGITGSQTKLTSEAMALLEDIRQRGARTIAGFGISSKGQIELLAGHSDAVVAGTFFVRTIAKAQLEGEAPTTAVRIAAEKLLS